MPPPPPLTHETSFFMKLCIFLLARSRQWTGARSKPIARKPRKFTCVMKIARAIKVLLVARANATLIYAAQAPPPSPPRRRTKQGIGKARMSVGWLACPRLVLRNMSGWRSARARCASDPSHGQRRSARIEPFKRAHKGAEIAVGACNL